MMGKRKRQGRKAGSRGQKSTKVLRCCSVEVKDAERKAESLKKLASAAVMQCKKAKGIERNKN